MENEFENTVRKSKHVVTASIYQSKYLAYIIVP